MPQITTTDHIILDSSGQPAEGRIVVVQSKRGLVDGDLVTTTPATVTIKGGRVVMPRVWNLPPTDADEGVLFIEQFKNRGAATQEVRFWVEVPDVSSVEYADLPQITAPTAGPGVPAWVAELLTALDDLETLNAPIVNEIIENDLTPEAAEAIAARPELSATFVPQGGRGQTFMSKLRMGASCVIAAAGDSTMDERSDYFDIGVTDLVSRVPSASMNIRHWVDGSSAYDTATPSLTGVSARTLMVRDTFERTSADLVGSTPDVGTNWTAGGSGAGDWEVAAGAAKATSDTTRGRVHLAVTAGDLEVRTKLVIPGTASPNIIVKRVDDSNQLFAVVARFSGNDYTLTLSKRIGGTTTTVAQSATFPRHPDMDDIFDVVLSVVGTRFVGRVNGVAIGGLITSGDATAVAASTQIGLTGNLASTDVEVQEIEAYALTAISSPATVTALNGAFAGSQLSYQRDRVATLYPSTTPIDVLVIGSGLNYGTATPATYLAAIDEFVAAFRAVQPDAEIVIASQNQRFSPANNIETHRARSVALAAYAASRGFGYIANAERYAQYLDSGASMIIADGIHPYEGGRAPAGQALQSEGLANYFLGL